MAKLIEVSLPLDAINAEAAREKSIRHGHPSTLHLWWARRPLAAGRAVLWASLVDDPSSHPELFPTEEEQTQERRRLHKLLTELVKWENSNDRELLEQARAEIKKSMGDETLVFLDPFAGGGSIPLEAQRLGLEAHAHDLNPVAVLINKAMIEIPPKFADKPPVNPESRTALRGWPGPSGLAEDVRYYGQWMKEQAYRRIGHLYPKVKLPDGGYATVIAWIWARTVKCPNPACGCEMPLASSFMLSKKKGKEAWIEPIIDGKNISYKVRSGGCPKGKESNKLAKGANFKCPACGTVTEKKYIHDVFVSRKNGAALMAIVAEGKNGRVYISPTLEHVKAAQSAVPPWEPEEEMNVKCTDLISGRGYGFTHWRQLFTPRQLTALTTFSDLVAEAQKKAEVDAVAAGLPDDGIGLAAGGSGAKAYGEAVGVYLAFVVDKIIDRNSSFCSWDSSYEKIRNTFGRQAIPMVWDHAESNPFCASSGSFDNMLAWVEKCVKSLPICHLGNGRQQLAQDQFNLNNLIISSDPPYYDNISYGDLSDFFYIWLRKALKNTFPNIFRTMLVPKVEELVATPYRFNGDKKKAKEFFEDGMKEAFKRMREAAREDAPITIYYAFKQAETDEKSDNQAASTGWETMLSALIDAGLTITGTWPLRTELANRQIASNTNALASSIVLVCRKRPAEAAATTRRAFTSELKKSLPSALKRLQESNIAPVDMAQAAIGPGMAVFSKFAKVLEADGSPMSVRSALQMINGELDAYFSSQEGDLDEGTRFCLALYSQYCLDDLTYGEADVLARAKNTSVEKLADLGALKAHKGIVRLLASDDLPNKPPNHERLKECLWTLTQYLTKKMLDGGVEACAAFINAFDGEVEPARDFAYRLFAIAERKKWNKEAYAYNSLVASWQDALTRARELRGPRQATL